MSATGQKIWEFIKKQGAFLSYLLWHDPWLGKWGHRFSRLSRKKRLGWLGAIVGGAVFSFGALPFLVQASLGARILAALLTPIASWIAKLLAMVGQAFNEVINGPLFSRIISMPAVDIGWTATRDVCNLVFILILLGIGFATILRVPTYHIKKLIVPFIVALLLINFSKLICGVVTDFCHILMASFAAAIDGSNYSGSIAGNLGLDKWLSSSRYTKDTETIDSYEGVQLLLTIIVFMIALIFAFLLLIVLMVSRWITLMVLTIFSPLVYAAQILPATQGFAKKWWQQFLQAAFYGPAAVFLVYLALQIVAATVADGFKGKNETTASGTVIAWETLVALMIACILLYKAVTFSKNLGIAGASGIIRTGTSWAKKGAGAVGGVAAGLANATGLPSKLKTAMQTRREAKEAARKETGERWGAALGQKTLMSSKAREKAKQKQQGLWAGREKQVAEEMNPGGKTVAELNAKFDSGTREEKLAAGTELAKRGELDKTGYDSLKNMGGVSATGLAKLKDEMVKHNPYATLEGTTDQAKRAEMDKIMATANLKDLSPKALTGAGSDMLMQSMASQRGSKSLIDAYENLTSATDKGMYEEKIKEAATESAGRTGTLEENTRNNNILRANLAVNQTLPAGASGEQLEMLAQKGEAKDLGQAVSKDIPTDPRFYQKISVSKLSKMAESMNADKVQGNVQTWQAANVGNPAQIDAARRNVVIGSYLSAPPPPPPGPDPLDPPGFYL